jgi:hypothetical protein
MTDPKYIPPPNGKCLIDKLPPDILSSIFRLGTQAQLEDDEWFIQDDDGDEDYEDVSSSEEEHARDETGGNVNGDEKSVSIPPLIPTSSSNARVYDATSPEEENPVWTLPFQVRVSHVCRKWRRIALDCPLLWTSITFHESYPFSESEAWLHRSKQCPLDISLDIPPYDDELKFSSSHDDEDVEYDADPEKKGLERLKQILDIIMPQVRRWKSFDLSTVTYEQAHTALKSLGDCPSEPGAPLLEELSLYCDEDTAFERFMHEQYKSHILLFGGHAPKLTNLGLWSVHLDWNLLLPQALRSGSFMHTSSQLPVANNLREIELSFHATEVRPSLDQFLMILKASPCLESLKLACSGPILSSDITESDRISLPNLRLLFLASLDEPYATKIIRLLHTPGLVSFGLDFDDGSYREFVRLLAQPVTTPTCVVRAPFDDSNDEAIRSLLEMSLDATSLPRPASLLSNLTFLKLSGLFSEDGCARILYEGAPRVEKLYLNLHYLPETFLSLLIANQDETIEGAELIARAIRAGTPQAPPLLPQLKELTIGGVQGDSICFLITARKVAGVPLQSLHIEWRTPFVPEDRAWIYHNVDTVDFVELSDEELDFEELSISDGDDDGGNDDEDGGENGGSGEEDGEEINEFEAII